MVHINFKVQCVGGDVLQLPVEIITPLPVVLRQADGATAVAFRVGNPTSNQVRLTNLSGAVTSGPTLVEIEAPPTITIEANATAASGLVLTPLAIVVEGTELEITVTGEESTEPPLEKPGPTNTGTTGTLIPSSGVVARTPGQVIANLDMSGVPTLAANGVTLRNCRIDGKNTAWYGILDLNEPQYRDTLVEDCELVSIKSAALYGRNFIARRCNIHEIGGDGFKARENTLVEGCWVHHLGTTEGAHADANQTRGGSHLVFRGNNFDIPIGQPGYRSNACFMMNSSLYALDDVLIEENWLNGGNHTVFFTHKPEFHGAPTNIRVLNNRFGRGFRYTTFNQANSPISEYVAAGNTWEDTGELLPWNNS